MAIIACFSANLQAQTPSTFTASNVKVMDTLTSVNMVKAAEIVATETITAKDDIVAQQDVKVSGVLDVAGTVNFKTKMVLGATPSSGITMQYVPGTSNYPSLFKFSAPGGTGILNGGNAGTIAPEDSQPNLTCINGPIPGIANAFSQMVSVAFNPTNPSITGGQVLIGHNGVNAFFDTQGSGALSNPANNHPGDLFINGFCNRNVLFFGHSTPFGANATNIVSIDGALNVRQRMQLGYNSANNFVEPNNKLYVLNDVASIGDAIKIKNGSGNGSAIKIAAYNGAGAISVTNNNSFIGDGSETFKVSGDGKTEIKASNASYQMFKILNASTNIDNFVIYGDGRINQGNPIVNNIISGVPVNPFMLDILGTNRSGLKVTLNTNIGDPAIRVGNTIDNKDQFLVFGDGTTYIGDTWNGSGLSQGIYSSIYPKVAAQVSSLGGNNQNRTAFHASVKNQNINESSGKYGYIATFEPDNVKSKAISIFCTDPSLGLPANTYLEGFRVYADGKTYIGGEKVGGTHANALLQVAGQIVCKSLYVIKPAQWQDRVFNKDYKLMNIYEVESFIKDNKRLPGIKSEKEILENGYDINNIDAALLEKIENLYLYIIQQQKEIDELKSRLDGKR